tara:strand:- start:238 stop:885 length:648 start_codon:yes stop_codon:yes gene_type:complete
MFFVKMGTNIDDLINDISNNKLSSDENSMVDSIINDLNIESGGGMKHNSQQQQQQHQNSNVPPHLTPEEKQMLLKQQQHQQQMMYEQQMKQNRLREMQQLQQQQQQQKQQQQQEQQQQKNEMEQKMEEMKKELEKKNSSFFNNPQLKNILLNIKSTLVVFLLIIFFNVNSIDEFLRFKKFSLFYNIQDEKSTLLFTFFKGLLISSFYYMITSLLK